jgi:hypothetical protein
MACLQGAFKSCILVFYLFLGQNKVALPVVIPDSCAAFPTMILPTLKTTLNYRQNNKWTSGGTGQDGYGQPSGPLLSTHFHSLSNHTICKVIFDWPLYKRPQENLWYHNENLEGLDCGKWTQCPLAITVQKLMVCMYAWLPGSYISTLQPGPGSTPSLGKGFVVVTVPVGFSVPGSVCLCCLCSDTGLSHWSGVSLKTIL